MRGSASDIAIQISRTLISASNTSIPSRTWTPSLEQSLHRLHCRNSLTPSLVARVIDPFLLHHHSLALGFFNWASQQPGFSHTSFTYQSVLKSLSISRQFNAMDKLLKQAKTQKFHLDPALYRSIIASHIAGKRTQNAFSIFNEVSALNLDVGPGTCNSLLAALASDGLFDDAQKVFDKMTSTGVGFSTLGFGVFVWRLCGKAGTERILSMLDEVKKGNSEINGSVVAVLVIHGLCMQSRVSEAFWMLDELRIRDCKPDFMAYSIVAEAFRLSRSVVDVEKVLKKKRKLGVAPRANDYRDFIFSLISERRICEAKQLGEVIVTGKFPIEDDVLNALIGSVSTIDPCTSLLFLKFMVGREKFPTLLTLNNLSRNLCKHGKVDELLEVFRVLSDKEYFSDMESYNVKVSFLCKCGRVREAYEVLREMKKKGLCVDVSFYNSLIESCCKQDLLRPVKRLWDEMFTSGCGANLTTYNILIQKFSEIGDVEESRSMFGDMLEKGVAPDAVSYISLLDGLCRGGKLEGALEVFDKCIEQDGMLAQSILSRFIHFLCKAGYFQAASKLLSGLPYGIGHSDSHVILLKFLVEAGDVSSASEHISWVADSAPSLLQAICTELLASVSSSSKPEPIMSLLHSVKGKRGLIFNNDSWKQLLDE